MKMRMTNEFITPEKAGLILEKNSNNRNVSKNLVDCYAKDILAGNWDEEVGSAISIDADGILRDGQHRLMAIVRAGVGVRMWVCRGVSSDGIYDCNRKRSNADQVSILRPDFESVYRGNRYIAIARAIIGKNTHHSGSGGANAQVTPKEIIDFTELHKHDLDGFFLRIPMSTVPKISITVVYLSLYMAYMAGVDIEKIAKFYEILCSGMSTKPEDFPVIAVRNYLKDHLIRNVRNDDIGRIQYALKKYITGSCTKKSTVPKGFIYPYPYENEVA